MTRRLLLVFALLALGIFPGSARAQDQNDGTLHVMRPIIHAEQEDAEFCLEFDHALDTTDHRRAASGKAQIRRKKPFQVASQNISIAGNLLCLSALEHQQEYRLVVAGLRGAKGEKLAGAYSLGFSIPVRHPSLAFTGEADAGGLMRWQDRRSAVARTSMFPRVKLELFRVCRSCFYDRSLREPGGRRLAPSESATFAHDHGQLVWSGNLDIDGDANKTSEQKVPLGANAVNPLPSGTLPDRGARAQTRVETGTESLVATGAIWLLRFGFAI